MVPLATITQEVDFDISVSGFLIGKITFGLYGDLLPLTVSNFATICEGKRRYKRKKHHKKMTYKNTKFHRVIPGFMAQSGDFEFNNGKGGDSIYKGKFKDENLKLSFSKPYLLAMANQGKDSNTS